MTAVQLSRRRVLQAGLLAGSWPVSAVMSAAELGTPQPRAKACILIFLDGGASHIDLLDMKPEAPAEIRGPFQPIASSVPGLQVCEHLPHVARQMHHMTLVRSMCHKQVVHDPAVYQMLTGYPHISSAGGLEVQPSDLPQVGAAFGRADRRPAVMPKVIQLPETMCMNGRVLPGQSAGFLGKSYDPFAVDVTSEAEVHKPVLTLPPEITPDRFTRWTALLGRFNHDFSKQVAVESAQVFDEYRQQALALVATKTVEQAFDLEREPDALRDRYGRNRHGQSVLLARRLVEAGARFITVYWGREPQDWADGKGARPANNPWDTHRNHFPLVRDSLVPRADRALAALIDDLHQRGQLDDTLVVWMGDFGRTPKISKPWASRDHWPHAFSLLMAGAGLPAGAIYGATDKHAAEVTDRRVSPADLTATIFTLLGIDPGATLRGPQGRDHALSTGRPIREFV